ncbi:MAG: hypothetical protein SFW36_06480 [Leptolyngbyaceae cyanobacterium bins.59]|nr:hypothetical protein [Leptolyngbyaceae cyanobacterium bins.59]
MEERHLEETSPLANNGLPQVSIDPTLSDWGEVRSQTFHPPNGGMVSASNALLNQLLDRVAPPQPNLASEAYDEEEFPSHFVNSELNQTVDRLPGAEQGDQWSYRLPEGLPARGSLPFPDPSGGSIQTENSTLQTPTMPLPDPQPMPVTANPTPAESPMATEAEETAVWQRYLIVGGSIAAVLFFGALLRNSSVFLGSGSPPAPIASPTTKPGASRPINPPARAGNPANPARTGSQPANGGQPVPPAPLSQEQINRNLLNEAKASIQTNQVSQFRQAIERASRIQPDQPLYPEAQESIQRWSLIILDTAEGRASQGRYTEAIRAAQLIPKTQPELYNRAQQAIVLWRTAPTSSPTPSRPAPASDRLTQAKRIIRPGEASSYNKAISIARRIPSSAPEYPESQRLLKEWSQTILNLAQNRANRDNYSLAIQAALLVPPGTPAYAQAQKSVTQWSQELLDLARQRASQRRFRTAIRTAQLIPQDSPLYNEAQAAIGRWERRRL